MLSVVIPVYNEAPSLQELHAELHWAFAYQKTLSPRRWPSEGGVGGWGDTQGATPSHSPSNMEGEKHKMEVIFVDDGSTDRSWEVLAELAMKDPRVVLVRLRRNSGKSIAYVAGFREARGDVIATLDADLQDDPKELPKLLERIGNPSGHDCVIGWKWDRQDPAVKVWSSRCFNAVLGWMCGVRLHDQNCGMRVLRREVADALHLHGDLYRMIPTLAAMAGFRVTEVPVRHRPRRFGESKYGRTGLRRTLRGFFDLLTITFLRRFRSRPLHFFGAVGGVLLLIGITINAYLTVLWLSGQKIGDRPLLLLGVLLMVLGVQFFSTGFLADLVVAGRERSDALPIAEIRRSS
ncbi:glycosyltransferase family 2 protein [Candidatus Uhrbacteria bacterium]|nr:glycosyltransferase family 2 protein [Candidatus Uhrbacteria bacterium]